jgi:hypothetical protein
MISPGTLEPTILCTRSARSAAGDALNEDYTLLPVSDPVSKRAWLRPISYRGTRHENLVIQTLRGPWGWVTA